MNCLVCGAEFERRGKRGPTAKRCPACCDADKRTNRVPKGKPLHPCSDCGTQTTSKTRCPACSAARRVRSIEAWRKAHPDKAREAHRKHVERFPWKFRKRFSVFGVTESEFASMLAAQNGQCAVCGTTNAGPGGWNLDHDHGFDPKDRAGHRGVLCRACNLMLGNARDDAHVLAAAIAYLHRHRSAVRLVK